MACADEPLIAFSTLSAENDLNRGDGERERERDGVDGGESLRELRPSDAAGVVGIVETVADESALVLSYRVDVDEVALLLPSSGDCAPMPAASKLLCNSLMRSRASRHGSFWRLSAGAMLLELPTTPISAISATKALDSANEGRSGSFTCGTVVIPRPFL